MYKHKEGNAIVGVIIAVLVIAGGVFVYTQQSSSEDPSATTTAQQGDYFSTSSSEADKSTKDSTQKDKTDSPDASSVSEVALWNEAVEGNGSVRCSLDTQMVPAESSTIYVSSGRARLESTFSDKPNKIFIVDKSGDSYMWKEGSETGRKKSEYNILRQTLNVFVDHENQETLSKQHPVAEKKELKSIEDVIATSIVECEQASVDESLFEKPEGVNFSG